MKRFVIGTVSSACLLSTAAIAATQRNAYVTQELYAQNHPYAAQLPQELATKMQKMSANAFAFYRGTAHLYFKDVTTVPSAFINAATEQVWVEGDAHVQNFGAQRDANGNDVFTLSDFDEGYWGPYVWDVWRGAVGILLAGEQTGLSSSNRDAAVNTFVEAYLDKMTDFKGNDGEKTYRLTTSNTSGVVKNTIEAAAAKTRADLLAKYSSVSNGQRSFMTTAELLTVSSSTTTSIANALTGYVASIAPSKRYASSYYTLKDVRLKLGSGVGSLGRYRYWLLLEGPSSSTADDVIVEMKQAATSAVALASPGGFPAYLYGNSEGQRVAMTLKAQLSNADVLTGHTVVDSIPYFLREKSPYQEDFDYTKLTSSTKWNEAAAYLGKALASAHALADKDYDITLIPYSEDKEVADVTDTYHDEFRAEVLAFAKDYAQQVKYDYQSFLAAYSAGQPLY